MKELDVPTSPDLFRQRYCPESEYSEYFRLTSAEMRAICPTQEPNEPDLTISTEEIRTGSELILATKIGPVVPPNYLETGDDSLGELFSPFLDFSKRTGNLIRLGNVPIEVSIQAFEALCRLQSLFRATPVGLARIFEFRAQFDSAHVFAALTRSSNFDEELRQRCRTSAVQLGTESFLEPMVRFEFALSYYSRHFRQEDSNFQKSMKRIRKYSHLIMMRFSFRVRHAVPSISELASASAAVRHGRMLRAIRASHGDPNMVVLLRAFQIWTNPLSLLTPILNERSAITVYIRALEVEISRVDYRAWILSTLDKIDDPSIPDMEKRTHLVQLVVRTGKSAIESSLLINSSTGRVNEFKASRPLAIPPTVS